MIDDITFKSNVLKLHGRRKHLIKKSYTTKQAWRWVKKNKWLNINQPISERTFGKVIRLVNLALQDKLLTGSYIKFPKRMGKLELIKTKSKIELTEEGIKTNIPIDWNKTVNYWSKDEEAYNKKLLLRVDNRVVFRVKYNKKDAIYKNKSCFQFKVNRDFKKKLCEKIKNNELDAFLSYGIH